MMSEQQRIYSSPHRGEVGRGAEDAHTYPLQAALKHARELRARMTDAEKLLWRSLRQEQLGVKFRKQHPVGPYIVDFACIDSKLIVELDGGQHNDDAAVKKDTARTQFLEDQGFVVLRFWNHELFDQTEAVVEKIFLTAQARQRPHPNPPPTGERTVSSLLRQARSRLIPVAGELAALEARLLAQAAWGMTQEVLVRDAEREVAADKTAAFDTMMQRRLKHEPVAHILGHKDFWKDRFLVTGEVLTPRADSETLIETFLALRPDTNIPSRILDLGTGSGCLLLSLLREYPNATGLGLDRSAQALAVAQKNGEVLGLAGRAEFKLGDWCETLAKSEKFDMVVTNPPYIPRAEIAGLAADVRDHEPEMALDGGEDGLDGYRSILAQLPLHLAAQALIVCEIGSGQAEPLSEMARSAGYEIALVAKDLAGTERAVALQQTNEITSEERV